MKKTSLKLSPKEKKQQLNNKLWLKVEDQFNRSIKDNMSRSLDSLKEGQWFERNIEFNTPSNEEYEELFKVLQIKSEWFNHNLFRELKKHILITPEQCITLLTNLKEGHSFNG